MSSKVKPDGAGNGFEESVLPIGGELETFKERVAWHKPGGSLEKAYDNKWVQIVMAVALFVALFTVDIRDVSLSGNGGDEAVCVVLLLVLILFAVEMPVCWLCKDGYKWSFFFWMDLLGTVSLIFDICYFFPSTSDSNAAVLRASRASRIGARAARLTKLIRLLKVVRIVRVVKLFKFFKVFKGEEEENTEEVSASKISQQLSEMISKRVAGLVMLSIIVVPLLAYEGVDASLPAHLDHFDAAVTDGTGIADKTLDSFFKFYDDSYVHPYMLRAGGGLEHANDLHGCFKFDAGVLQTPSLKSVCECLTIHDADTTFEDAKVIESQTYQVCTTSAAYAQGVVNIWYRSDLEGSTSRETVSRVSWNGDKAQIVYNASEFVQYSAMMNIFLLLFVIVLLVSFSTTLNGKINQMVLRPLDRIFTSIKDAMSDVISAVSKTSKNNGKGGGSELEIMEKAISKLSKLGDHVTLGAQGGGSKHVVAVMEDKNLDEGTKEWLAAGYTTGHTKEATIATKKPKHRVTEHMTMRRNKTKMQMKADLSKFGKAHVTTDLIETFDYDVLLYTKDELQHHIHWIFTHTHCTADFDFSPKTSYAFIKAVQAKYNDANPYHNFFHAGDVIQTLFMYIRANSGETLLSGLDIFAALVGALAHDIGHPGVNAGYLVNTRHDLAMTYNDTSVLENMHVATLYKLLRDEPTADPFQKLTDADWKAARKTIVSGVLATDMAHHFTMVSEADVFFQVNEGKLSNSTDRVALFRENPKNADFLVRLWMHTADISNPVKNFTVCQKWCTAVTDEFFAQGDRERTEGMPVSAMMDRDTTNTSQLQVNFIEFVVGPLYAGLIKIFPEIFELGIQVCYNRKQWGDKWMLDLEKKATIAEQVAVELGTEQAVAKSLAAKETVAEERKKNEARRVAFEGKFSFIAEREEQMSRTNPTRHLLVPGAKPFNFIGSAGPGIKPKIGLPGLRGGQ
jgi:cAMP-specific phosphodiesterase 4